MNSTEYVYITPEGDKLTLGDTLGDTEVRAETVQGKGVTIWIPPDDSGDVGAAFLAREAKGPLVSVCFSCKPNRRVTGIRELLDHVRLQHPEVWDAYQQWEKTGPPAESEG